MAPSKHTEDSVLRPETLPAVLESPQQNENNEYPALLVVGCPFTRLSYGGCFGRTCGRRGGLYYRILNVNDGPECWVFGKVVAVSRCGPARLWEPGPGHPATGTITGWGWGSSRGSGMVERSASTTVKPRPPPKLSSVPESLERRFHQH